MIAVIAALAVATAVTGGLALATSSDRGEPGDIRAIYGVSATSADDLERVRDLGVNTIHSRASRATLDQLNDLGMRTVIWLGEYHRDTCTFEFDDDLVATLVTAVAGHPAVAAYQVADEPRTTDCPGAYADIAARAELISSLDDSAPTYVTVDAWNGSELLPYGDFAGATDIMGLVVYPCELGRCDLGIIDEAIESARDAGVERYWAVVQGFADDYYSLPDAETFATQLDRWSDSDAEGIAIFSWEFGTDDVSRNAELQEVIRSTWAGTVPLPSRRPEAPATSAKSAATAGSGSCDRA